MNFSKAHFIGIAGKGMSATALLLRQMGVQITGSDEGFYPPVSDYLKNEKIPFAEGYRKENIPDDADVIVIGKNAKLQPESNEEVRAAMDSGKPVRSFADLLHDMTANADTIVAAGSYGKSTCTALLAWCLKVANKDPSYFIGEITNGFETARAPRPGPDVRSRRRRIPGIELGRQLEIPALQRQKRPAHLGDPRPHQRVSDPRGLSRPVSHPARLAAVRRASGRQQQRASRARPRRKSRLPHCLLRIGRQGALACRKYRTRRGNRFRPDARRRKDRSPVDQNARRSQHRKYRRRQRDAAGEEAAVAGGVERRHQHVPGRETPHGIALARVEGAGLRRFWIVLRKGQMRHRRHKTPFSRPAADHRVRAAYLHLAKPGGDRRL